MTDWKFYLKFPRLPAGSTIANRQSLLVRKFPSAVRENGVKSIYNINHLIMEIYKRKLILKFYSEENICDLLICYKIV